MNICCDFSVFADHYFYICLTFGDLKITAFRAENKVWTKNINKYKMQRTFSCNQLMVSST